MGPKLGGQREEGSPSLGEADLERVSWDMAAS